jgi:hypothetical protein
MYECNIAPAILCVVNYESAEGLGNLNHGSFEILFLLVIFRAFIKSVGLNQHSQHREPSTSRPDYLGLLSGAVDGFGAVTFFSAFFFIF